LRRFLRFTGAPDFEIRIGTAACASVGARYRFTRPDNAEPTPYMDSSLGPRLPRSESMDPSGAFGEVGLPPQRPRRRHESAGFPESLRGKRRVPGG
jgi:hypothetical protein